MPAYLPFKGGVKSNWRVKRAIYKEYARTAIGYATVIGSIAMISELFYDDDDEDKPTIEWDPKSADAGKVRIGDTRLDFLAGLQQPFVFSVRLLPKWLGGGAIKSTVTGKVREFGEGYNPMTRADLIQKFVRTKLAPVPGDLWTMADDWTDVVGQKHTPVSLAKSFVTPLAIRDILETEEMQGMPKGTALGILALLGAGMNTYGPTTEYATGTPKERKKQFEEDLNRIEWDTGDAPYTEYLTPSQQEQWAARLKRRRQNVIYEALDPAPQRDDDDTATDFQKKQESHQRMKDRFSEMIQTLDMEHDDAQQLLTESQLTRSNRLTPNWWKRSVTLAEMFGHPNPEQYATERSKEWADEVQAGL